MDNATGVFSAILTGGFDGLKTMIGVQEEHLFLDFKEKNRTDIGKAEKSDRHTYAEALSGFSNSSGGVIVWGIKARKVSPDGPDVVQQLVPLNEVSTFVAELNSYLHQALTPHNPGVRNEVIMDPRESDTGFVLTFVPESDIAPHMAKLGKDQYFVRIGSSFVVMEHYMLADMFGRRQRPKLELGYKVSSDGSTKGPNINQISCRIVLGIRNVGRYVALYPGLSVSGLTHQLYGRGSSRMSTFSETNASWGIQSAKGIVYSQLDDHYIWTGGNDDPIHPSTSLEVCDLRATFDVHWLDGLNEDYRLFGIAYSLYSEGCAAIQGHLVMTAGEIREVLNPFVQR